MQEYEAHDRELHKVNREGRGGEREGRRGGKEGGLGADLLRRAVGRSEVVAVGVDDAELLEAASPVEPVLPWEADLPLPPPDHSRGISSI